MKIKLNPDQEIVNTIREGLKRTGGYCPCRRERTEATKCMCQEFKDQIADPLFEGFCHCMLYYKSLQDQHYCTKQLFLHLIEWQELQTLRYKVLYFFAMTGYTTFSLSYPLISTPPNCFNIRFICVCCNFCSYSANMLGNNTTISLTVISPNSFINSLFIKNLSCVLR